MLNYAEVRQLSDRDLADELASSRNSLFRQRMGVRTGHLKDSHLIQSLKKYVAQLLTEMNRRKEVGEKVEKTSVEVTKKAKDAHSEIEKAQIKKDKGKRIKEKVEEINESEKKEEIEKKSSADVKVRQVEKKGWFGRRKKAEVKDH